MADAFTNPLANVGLKVSIHGALAGLAALCGLYSVVAYRRRPARHLLINAMLYSAWTVYEAIETVEHARSANAL